MRRSVLQAVILATLCGAARAGPVTIAAGNHTLPDDGGMHVIAIEAHGAGDLSGVNLNLMVADGGSSFGGLVDGPMIDLLDAQSVGTIFFGNAGVSTFATFGQVATESFMTLAGTEDADANGNILAYVTIDLSGFNATSPGDLGPGKWMFRVAGYVPVLFPGSDWDGSAGVTPVPMDGFIQIVPEPGSVVLCLLAAAGVTIAAVGGRRRRAAR